MMWKRFIVLIFTWSAILVLAPEADAFIVINEILADPAPGIDGDANRDGIRSTSDDEFVELLNFGDDPVDISGWSLTDSVKTRHIFDDGTFLDPDSYIVVFGGGEPFMGEVIWQTASSGSLGLNNSGDIVSLFDADGKPVDEVAYGSLGGKDQSLARFEEGTGGEFFLHSTIITADGKLFSPGESIDGLPLEHASVPEPLSAFLFGAGVLVAVRKKRKDVPSSN